LWVGSEIRRNERTLFIDGGVVTVVMNKEGIIVFLLKIKKERIKLSNCGCEILFI